MKVLKTPSDVIHWKKTLDSKDIGFVPTMGGLHEGHCSLIKRSLMETSSTIVSIFLNPKQFNNRQDFESYPATWIKTLKN